MFGATVIFTSSEITGQRTCKVLSMDIISVIIPWYLNVFQSPIFVHVPMTSCDDMFPCVLGLLLLYLRGSRT